MLNLEVIFVHMGHCIVTTGTTDMHKAKQIPSWNHIEINEKKKLIDLESDKTF